MKLGTATSTVLHAAILSWGLLNLSAPQVQQIELSGVEIDFEASEVSKPVIGDKDASLQETPAPKPTQKPVEEPKPEAQNVGESKDDTKTETKAKPADKAVESAATAKKPEPKVEKPEPKPEAKPKPKTVATPELASKTEEPTPVQKVEPKPEPAAEPKQTQAQFQIASLPSALPVPNARPKPTRAKTTQRKVPDETKSASKNGGKKDTKDKVGDEIKNLITKEEAAGGGSKKSEKKVAGLGASTGRSTGKLSQSELDRLRSAISNCTTGLAGQIISPELQIKIVIHLNPDGSIKRIPVIDTQGGTVQEKKRFGAAMLRAVKRCAPYDFLPKDKYETWAEVVPTFHPAQMFQ